MLGFGPFCLDFGHIAWIWAIWHNLGQNRPQRRQSPEDGVEGDERTDGRTDRFPLCSTGLRPLQGRCPAPPQLKSQTTQAGHGYR